MRFASAGGPSYAARMSDPLRPVREPIRRAQITRLASTVLVALVAGRQLAIAKPIPVASDGIKPTRLRSEVALVDEPSRHATEYLEIARDGATYTFSWALAFPDGAVWSEVASGEVRDGMMIPTQVRRTEQDAKGQMSLDMNSPDLTRPVVKVRVARGGSVPDEDEISVDDPPLYPPVMTGTLYHHLFEPGASALKFSTLADYPWGLGAAPMEAVVSERAEPADVALGSRLLRRVTLRPVMPWPLASMVDAIGIDTAVFLWVTDTSPHGLQRYEGAYRYDSGRYRGDVVEQRDLAEGERSAAWPPLGDRGSAQPQARAAAAIP